MLAISGAASACVATATSNDEQEFALTVPALAASGQCSEPLMEASLGYRLSRLM
jgi:hypothetical protein